MSDDVHVGEDGWLFLTGGQNSPVRMYRRSAGHLWLMLRWARLLFARARRCRALGARYLHLTVPEKLSIYADKAPSLQIDPRLGFGRRLCRVMRDPVLCPDASRRLIAERAQADMFMRTDSHWTSEGSMAAHDLICEAVGAPLRWKLDERLRIPVEGFVGDLGVKLPGSPSERLVRYDVRRDAACIEANDLVRRYERTERLIQLHRGTHVVMRNEASGTDSRRVVLFGDSYSHFSTHALTAMLAETFREVHFIWSTSIDWSYVERARPDLVITEIAERFMVLLPRDEGYDNEVFAAARLAEMDAGAA